MSCKVCTWLKKLDIVGYSTISVQELPSKITKCGIDHSAAIEMRVAHTIMPYFRIGADNTQIYTWFSNKATNNQLYLLWWWFFGVESSTIYIVLIVVLVWTFLATCSVITKRKIIATRMIKFQHNCNMFQQRERTTIKVNGWDLWYLCNVMPYHAVSYELYCYLLRATFTSGSFVTSNSAVLVNTRF